MVPSRVLNAEGSGACCDKAQKVAILCPFPEYFIETLKEHHDVPVILNGKLESDFPERYDVDLIIVCGHDYKIPENITSKIRCIGIHFSMLPHGRGPEPLLASLISGERTGVTIYEITDERDAGRIIVQEEFKVLETDTLKTLMDKAFELAGSMIADEWKDIRSKEYMSRPQKGKGSSHDNDGVDRIFKLAVRMSDKPIGEFLEKVKEKFPNFKMSEPFELQKQTCKYPEIV